MSLSDLASLGSFVSGIAVLVSLIFVYFQIRQVNQQVRQAEKNQQAVIRQSRSSRTIDNLLSAMEPSFSEILFKAISGSEDLPEAALARYGVYNRAMFVNWQDAFHQHNDGLLTDTAFAEVSVYAKNAMQFPGVRAQWRLHRAAYGPEFVAWMDKLTAETATAEGLDFKKEWKDALAAERAHAPY